MAERQEVLYFFEHETAPVLRAKEVLDSNNILRRQAEELASERKNGDIQPDFDPMIDLLGSARLLCAAEDAGRSSQETRQNLRNDIRTGLLEVVQENGHITVIDIPVNANGEANIAGLPLYEMFLRGIHSGRPDWVNNLGTINVHEEFLGSALFCNEALRNEYGLVVISPMPEDVGLTNDELKKEGFRPDTGKMMVRMHTFKPDGLSWRRETEQLCASGSDIQVVNNALRELGVLDQSEQDLSTTEALDNPFLLRLSDFPQGAAGVVRILDELKADKTGYEYFCGKESMASSPLSEMYAQLRQSSKEREDNLSEFIDELEYYAYALARSDNLSFEEQTRNYEQKKLQIVRKICALHPGYAEHAFGEDTAEHYKKAYQAVEDGDRTLAEAELDTAFESSNSIIMCGIEVTVSNPANPEEASAQSAEQKQEVIHCMELKIFGYTIRKGVNCPMCSKITGHRVDAYETVGTIKCLNGRCGYEVDKQSGDVLKQSGIVQEQEASDVECDNVANIIYEVVPSTLKSGQVYAFGTGQYEYRQKINVGGVEHQFIADNGSQIVGDEAEWLAEMLLSQPSSQVA
ncbi:MAG: hypothetical protein PVI21_02325 [Candidatus Woesebacteria bacterium]|jgi:hypothetical protein